LKFLLQCDALHWATIGDARARDTEIFAYAKEKDYIVFTHDLDFGSILAATNADAPSVIQARTQDTMPAALGARLLEAVRKFEGVLKQGALLTLDEAKQRIRVLPLR
jgi:predicted nuclease of predicted toxin-antitoxin system